MCRCKGSTESQAARQREGGRERLTQRLHAHAASRIKARGAVVAVAVAVAESVKLGRESRRRREEIHRLAGLAGRCLGSGIWDLQTGPRRPHGASERLPMNIGLSAESGMSKHSTESTQTARLAGSPASQAARPPSSQREEQPAGGGHDRARARLREARRRRTAVVDGNNKQQPQQQQQPAGTRRWPWGRDKTPTGTPLELPKNTIVYQTPALGAAGARRDSRAPPPSHSPQACKRVEIVC